MADESTLEDISMMLDINDLTKLKGITTVQWNCRSLYDKLDDVRLLLKDSKCEILIISETWLTDAVDRSLLEIDSYNIVRQDQDFSLGKTRGGGILVYYKHDLNLSVADKWCLNCLDTETITLKLSLPYVKPIYILCIYRLQIGESLILLIKLRTLSMLCMKGQILNYV